MRAWGARGQIIILVYMASNFKVYHLMKYILILNYIHKLIVVKLKKILSISFSKIKKKTFWSVLKETNWKARSVEIEGIKHEIVLSDILLIITGLHLLLNLPIEQ